MSGFFPFQLFRTTIGVAGFFGPQKKASGGGGGSTVFNVAGGGPQSTGPLANGGPFPSGDGTGYYDGSINGGFSAGNVSSPIPPLLNGQFVSTIGWQGAGVGFVITINGTHPQNFFTNCKIVSGATTLNFASASPNYFSSNTDYPGFSVWVWTDGHEFSVGLSNYTATFT